MLIDDIAFGDPVKGDGHIAVVKLQSAIAQTQPLTADPLQCRC